MLNCVRRSSSRRCAFFEAHRRCVTMFGSLVSEQDVAGDGNESDIILARSVIQKEHTCGQTYASSRCRRMVEPCYLGGVNRLPASGQDLLTSIEMSFEVIKLTELQITSSTLEWCLLRPWSNICVANIKIFLLDDTVVRCHCSCLVVGRTSKRRQGIVPLREACIRDYVLRTSQM
jgi:hypothetical protein